MLYNIGIQIVHKWCPYTSN